MPKKNKKEEKLSVEKDFVYEETKEDLGLDNDFGDEAFGSDDGDSD